MPLRPRVTRSVAQPVRRIRVRAARERPAGVEARIPVAASSSGSFGFSMVSPANPARL